MGMPVSSDVSWANAVSCPWPWPDVPTRMVAEPSSWTSNPAHSFWSSPAVIST